MRVSKKEKYSGSLVDKNQGSSFIQMHLRKPSDRELIR